MSFGWGLHRETPFPKDTSLHNKYSVLFQFLLYTFLPSMENKMTEKESLIIVFVWPQNLKHYGCITSTQKYFFSFLSPTLLKVRGVSGIRTIAEFF